MTAPISRLLPLLLLAVPGAAIAGNEGPLTLQNTPKPADKNPQQQQTVQQTEELHDIHGPLPLAGQPPYLIIGAIILVLLLILAAILLWLKKRGKKVTPAPSPWEIALTELGAAKPLQIAGQGLLYMEKASQVLRRYIESRFAIRSTRQTTREFLSGLNRAGNSPLGEYRAELQACLEQADMAKFAHRVPELSNMEQMELAVIDFVKKTEPPPPGGRS